MRRTIIGAVMSALAVTVVPTAAHASPTPGAAALATGKPRPVQSASLGEQQLALLINRTRARKGLAKLRYSTGISLRADPWARTLGRPRFAGRLAHDPNFFADIRRSCRGATAGSENVAARRDRLADRRAVVARRAARGLLRQYLNSPPHRANVLDSAATHFGIATVMRTRTSGEVYVANVLRFARAASC